MKAKDIPATVEELQYWLRFHTGHIWRQIVFERPHIITPFIIYHYRHPKMMRLKEAPINERSSFNCYSFEEGLGASAEERALKLEEFGRIAREEKTSLSSCFLVSLAYGIERGSDLFPGVPIEQRPDAEELVIVGGASAGGLTVANMGFGVRRDSKKCLLPGSLHRPDVRKRMKDEPHAMDHVWKGFSSA